MIRGVTGADLSVCENADSFLQSAMWGRFKARFGWEARAFIVEWESGGSKPLLTLSRRIVPGVSMCYIPWGPELPAAFPDDSSLRANVAAELARALRPHLPKSVAFIRFDPPWFGTDGAPPNLPAPFKRAAADIQPPDTVLVDLTPPVQDILTAMKPKWRYNISLAEKRGVIVSRQQSCRSTTKLPPGPELPSAPLAPPDIDIFYQLLTETAARDGIAVHSAEYYRALFEDALASEAPASDASQLCLYTAAHEGDVLAAIVVLLRGKEAVYLYGASANSKRNVMAPYALQWKAMQDAKAAGCTRYDLFGIPPNDDPNHPMAGLYRFKTGFGGKIIHRPGSWDYPCKSLVYALFSGAEYIRKKLRDSKKRRNVV